VSGTTTAVGRFVAEITVRDSTTPGRVVTVQYVFNINLP